MALRYTDISFSSNSLASITHLHLHLLALSICPRLAFRPCPITVSLLGRSRESQCLPHTPLAGSDRLRPPKTAVCNVFLDLTRCPLFFTLHIVRRAAAQLLNCRFRTRTPSSHSSLTQAATKMQVKGWRIRCSVELVLKCMVVKSVVHVK